LALPAFCLAGMGVPIPVAPLVDKGDEDFPCRYHACGCADATMCRLHCCCIPSQLSWERQRPVTPDGPGAAKPCCASKQQNSDAPVGAKMSPLECQGTTLIHAAIPPVTPTHLELGLPRALPGDWVIHARLAAPDNVPLAIASPPPEAGHSC
jgi:hypothetical protein